MKRRQNRRRRYEGAQWNPADQLQRLQQLYEKWTRQMLVNVCNYEVELITILSIKILKTRKRGAALIKNPTEKECSYLGSFRGGSLKHIY